MVDSGVGPKIQNCDDIALASHGVTPSSIAEQVRRAQVAIRAAIAAVDTVSDSGPREDKRSAWNALGFPEWFGDYSGTTLRALRFRYRTMKRTLASSTLKIECNKLDSYVCRNDPYAHVRPGTWKIWLCPEYWCASGYDDNLKALTFVHEAAHIVALGTDAANGADDDRDLAVDSPRRARANADSLAYFAMSLAFEYP
jgi:hypothetical protein